VHFVLMYDYAPDYMERRGEFRNEHLRLAWESHDRGELVLGGVLSDPVDSALIVFQGDSPEAAEAFAKSDPYVINGLVTRWEVRKWMTVAGELASNPLRSVEEN
jgi:uncharacterized protein